MFIETQPTPNPATLKFIPHVPLCPAHLSRDFHPHDPDLNTAPLAARLFGIDGVAGVFIAPDYVSVTKDHARDWQDLKIDVLTALMDHLSSGDAAWMPETSPAATPTTPHTDDPIAAQIIDLIEARVRPAVAADGGDIVFDRFEDGIVYVQLRGACAGCPSSSITLKNGIETMLKHYIPDVQAVEAVPLDEGRAASCRTA